MPVVCAAASSHVDVHGPGILQETVLVLWPVLPLRAIMVSKEHIVAVLMSMFVLPGGIMLRSVACANVENHT